jgi:hypothetical protein
MGCYWLHDPIAIKLVLQCTCSIQLSLELRNICHVDSEISLCIAGQGDDVPAMERIHIYTHLHLIQTPMETLTCDMRFWCNNWFLFENAQHIAFILRHAYHVAVTCSIAMLILVSNLISSCTISPCDWGNITNSRQDRTWGNANPWNWNNVEALPRFWGGEFIQGSYRHWLGSPTPSR